MLYKDTIAKETVLAVKGWIEQGLRVRTADLGKLKGDARQDMALHKQLVTELSGKKLENVLSKTYAGLRVLEEQRGGDPASVQDPGKKFSVTYNGQKGNTELPKGWVASLILMYCRGVETVPIVSETAASKLGKIIDKNPVISTPSEKLQKDADTFLKVMKDDCKVPVEDGRAPAPDEGDPDQFDQESMRVVASMDQIEGVYDIVPDLAGYDLVPELSQVHNEYSLAPAPAGRGGGSTSGGDEDPDHDIFETASGE